MRKYIRSGVDRGQMGQEIHGQQSLISILHNAVTTAVPLDFVVQGASKLRTDAMPNELGDYEPFCF